MEGEPRGAPTTIPELIVSRRLYESPGRPASQDSDREGSGRGQAPSSTRTRWEVSCSQGAPGCFFMNLFGWVRVGIALIGVYVHSDIIYRQLVSRRRSCSQGSPAGFLMSSWSLPGLGSCSCSWVWTRPLTLSSGVISLSCFWVWTRIHTYGRLYVFTIWRARHYGSLASIASLLALVIQHRLSIALVLLAMLFLEWHLFDFGGDFYRTLYISFNFRVRYFRDSGLSVSRLASTCTSPFTTISSSLVSITTLPIILPVHLYLAPLMAKSLHFYIRSMRASRLSSTFSSPPTRSSKTTPPITSTSTYSIPQCTRIIETTSLICTSAYSIIQRMRYMLRKTLQWHASSSARFDGGVAQVARRLWGRSKSHRLCRGSLPALTSCSQHLVVRCALVLFSMFYAQQSVHTRSNARWYILALSYLPWLLCFCRAGSWLLRLRCRRCFLANTIMRHLPERSQFTTICSSARARKTRRGVRGSGNTNYTYTMPSGPNGTSLGPGQSSTPSSRPVRTNDNSSRVPGPQTPHPSPDPSMNTHWAPLTSQTNGTSTSTLRILWWNVQGLAAIWHMTDFWDILNEHADVVFMNETHHTALPIHENWDVFGVERDVTKSAGGVLALVRRSGRTRLKQVEHPYDGYIWILLRISPQQDIWLGGSYIPGPADPRFRRVQGEGRKDHFAALEEQLDIRSNQLWLMGGDCNSITSNRQPCWHDADLLNPRARSVDLPARVSDDTRPTSSHGKRFLSALADKGMILNGIIANNFSGAFTRMPQRLADCPGVLDYVFGPPSTLPLLEVGSLRVLDTPPDLSDHLPIVVAILTDDNAPQDCQRSDQRFEDKRLEALMIPDDPEIWEAIDGEIGNSTELQEICGALKRHIEEPASRAEAQTIVDSSMTGLTALHLQSLSVSPTCQETLVR